MKKLLIMLVKIGLSAAIIGYLVWQATHGQKGPNGQAQNVFMALVRQPKDWGLLLTAFVATVVAIVLTLVRWCYLVRALGIDLSMRDAMRIGFVGYLFNLAPMGIVGGDVIKAVMLAREHPGNRVKALTSVLVDRIIGLYVLFVVASTAILLTGFYWKAFPPAVHLICQITLGLTAVGTVGIAALWIPGVLDGKWVAKLTRLPRIGPLIHSLLEAVHLYRRDLGVLALSCVMTVAVHSLLTTACFLIARGLPGQQPISLSQHFVVYPLSSVAQTVPLPAGPSEAALEYLYQKTCGAAEGRGLIVVLVSRLFAILIATVGFAYYLGSRGEVKDVLHEVEEEPAEQEVGET